MRDEESGWRFEDDLGVGWVLGWMVIDINEEGRMWLGSEWMFVLSKLDNRIGTSESSSVAESIFCRAMKLVLIFKIKGVEI